MPPPIPPSSRQPHSLSDAPGSDPALVFWRRFQIPVIVLIAVGSIGASGFACCCCFPMIYSMTPEGQRVAAEQRERNRQQKIIDDANAAQRAEDSKPKVTRVNYNRVLTGMSINEVENILGPGKENMRVGGFQTLTWHELFGPRITITFHNGGVSSKTIFD